MQSSAIHEAMGTDIAMLVDVRKRRQTFDTSEFMFKTGPVTVEFGKVQSKVSLKYDAWHKEMLVSFGQMMSDQMTTFHAEISRVGEFVSRISSYCRCCSSDYPSSKVETTNEELGRASWSVS